MQGEQDELDAKGNPLFGRFFWLSAVLAVVGAALSVTAWQVLRIREQESLRAEFVLDAAEQARLIGSELERNFEAVYALEAFFESSQLVERQEFKAFVRPQLDRHASIQALEWQPRVRAEQRIRHEEAARSELFDGYQIIEATGNGHLVRAGNREEYFPVHYVEPLEANLPAVGFDVASEPTRKTALVLARDSGRLTLTGPIRLVQETKDLCGVLAFLPVFEGGAPTSTPAERRRSLTGFVCCVLLVDNLVRHALEDSRRQGMHICVFDKSTPDNSLLYAYRCDSESHSSSGTRTQCHESIIEAGGRQWSIVCEPAAGYLTHGTAPLPWFVLSTGLLITGLVTAFVVSLGRQTAKVERLVVSRTAELRQANRALHGEASKHERAKERFRRLLESAPDAMVIVNREGSIVLANQQAERLFGRSAEELLGKPVEILIPERSRTRHVSQRGEFLRIPHARPMGDRGELRGLRKNGSEFPAEISLSPIETEEGMLIAATVRDITARKRAQDSLRQSEERFDLAVRGTDAGIWDWNLRTNEVYFSPRWKSMLGYEDDEIDNRFSEWESRLHPDDREMAARRLQDYLQGRSSSYELEHRLRHKDQSYRWILARGTVTRTADGEPCRMVGSHLDITEQREAQEAQIRRESQMLAAQKIQQHLLPVGSPRVPGLEVAGASWPAEFAGGDHFDYFELTDGSLAIVIGDVSGHDFGSALMMAATHTLVHLLVEKTPHVGEVLDQANDFLCKQTEEHRFVTMLLASIDPRRGLLTYANAGHPSGFILDAEGKVKCALESTALPLGVNPDTEYREVEVFEIQPSDVILLLTDGILEATAADGSQFGAARALEVVRAGLQKEPDEIIADLYQTACEFSADERLDDDVTCVVIKVQTRTGGTVRAAHCDEPAESAWELR